MFDKVDSVCRICFAASEDCSKLFDDDSTNYLETIKEYTGLEMIKHDTLPSMICKTCSSELMIVVQFISKCRTSCEKLENMLIENISLKEDIKVEEEEDDIALSLLCESKIKVEQIDEEDNDIHEYEDAAEVFSITEPQKRKYVRSKIRSPPLKKEKKEFVCDMCGIKTPSKSALIIHNRRHTGEKPYKCQECEKCFSQSSTLKEHIGRMHERVKQLSKKSCICDYCGKICYRKNELRVHVRVHTKEKPYKCTFCNESFSQQSSLIPHIRRHKGEKPFSCQICGVCFSSNSSLRSHMRVHSNEKKFKCHICDKLLKTSKALKNHILVHADVKPNICDKCGMRFSQKGNLKQHIENKHSERSGYCDICKRAYSDVITHNRIHTGDRPFKCIKCDKGFARKGHLTIHLRRHEEYDKYQCTFNKCEAAFSLQGQLDYHTMKFHTKQFAFNCSVCTKGFYRLTDLNRHKNLNPACKMASRPLPQLIKISHIQQTV